MENVRWSVRKSSFFIFASLLTYALGAFLAGFESSRINGSSLLIGILFFLTVLALRQLFNYLTSSKINPYSRVSFERGNRKGQLFIVTMVLFMLYLFLVYALLRLNKLIGVNLIYIVFITLLMLMTITRTGKMAFQTYSVIIEGLIVSPLMLLFGSGLQDLNPRGGHLFLTLAFFFLYIATRTSLLFEDYGKEQKTPDRSLLDLIGWESGIRLQNISLVAAYLIFFYYFFRNGSLGMNAPVLFTAIFGVFSMYLLNRMARGMKPHWQIIKATAFLHFFAVCYLLVFPLI